MIYTNLKVLVAQNNDPELMQRVAESMSDYATKNNHEHCDFSVEQDEGGFLVIKLPSPYSYDLLKTMIPSGELLEFKAIGDTVFELPYTVRKAYKHYFSEKEKSEIADNLCREQAEKESLVDEKKSLMKSYADKIENKETSISEFAGKYRQGWEDREQHCICQIDYSQKQKLYIDPESKEVLAMEDLSPSDYQLRLDSVRIENNIEENNLLQTESNEDQYDEDEDLPI